MAAPPIPINLLDGEAWEAFAAARPTATKAAASVGFTGKAGQLALIPGVEGALERVLFGLGTLGGALLVRGLSARLPPGDYGFEDIPPDLDPDLVRLAWSLGAYRFDRYKRAPGEAAPALVPLGSEPDSRAAVIGAACALARDLINTPANDMGPAQFEATARNVALAHGAEISVVVGDDLIAAGYPAVHAVGRAAVPGRAPRMIEITWGEAGDPLIALIGKGVVFDSGGLDIKPSAAMRWMKKDMGGAAHALALAQMVMAARLPVRLCILLPLVENAIAGDAMRPGDILASRAGLTIEVGNTDAEGRLILADALARAAELDPVLTLDLATLTGAARVALGPEIVPFYTDDDGLAAELVAASRSVEDPLWRMPLWDGYEASIDSDVADVRNDADAWAQAGSLTAALFLRRFAPKGVWAHFDIFAWNGRGRPGYPVGAEVQAIRALFALLRDRYR